MDVIAVDNILLDDKSQNKVWSRVNDDAMLIFLVNCPFKSPYTCTICADILFKEWAEGCIYRSMYPIFFFMSFLCRLWISQAMNRVWLTLRVKLVQGSLSLTSYFTESHSLFFCVHIETLKCFIHDPLPHNIILSSHMLIHHIKMTRQ